MPQGSVLSYTHRSGFEKYIVAYILPAVISRMVKDKGKKRVCTPSYATDLWITAAGMKKEKRQNYFIYFYIDIFIYMQGRKINQTEKITPSPLH